ncbi:NACHT domain protein [Cylindrospermum stagnale PCC 7417]|uniref:NACHT domain protein n=1 Tax=Cylindrospermum stagnale PCC 7417 TaxID=56107 RepID=K9WWC0_9NOST|nr:ATP-binding protein [Cylindrospermum stagnale]AFZ24675.1 NACHT domain protein [Cylindrospermum stagnale PCC 7417]
MNNSPSIANNNGRYPLEFQQVLQAHNLNFVGRGFVFTAISNFLQRYDRGYFTIVGTPGSGKSAILANYAIASGGRYAIANPQVVYYNAQVAGKNRADVFLASLCTQFTQPLAEISLQSLLQQVSNQLQPQQRLIIAIDAVDAIDRSFQSPSG